MMAVLNKTDGIPLYIQIRKYLYDSIVKNDLVPGQRLPSEDELAAQFGVSRMTARQGVSDLIDEGLLYRRRGIGTFVAQFHVERDHNRLTSFFDTTKAEEEEFEFEFRLLCREVVPAKLMIVKALA